MKNSGLNVHYTTRLVSLSSALHNNPTWMIFLYVRLCFVLHENGLLHRSHCMLKWVIIELGDWADYSLVIRQKNETGRTREWDGKKKLRNQNRRCETFERIIFPMIFSSENDWPFKRWNRIRSERHGWESVSTIAECINVYMWPNICGDPIRFFSILALSPH